MPKINTIEILTFLAECFPQALVREQHLPHKPLKIGIDVDLAKRCPAISRSERSVLLTITARG
jgi:sRNA-binding protein